MDSGYNKRYNNNNWAHAKHFSFSLSWFISLIVPTIFVQCWKMYVLVRCPLASHCLLLPLVPLLLPLLLVVVL